MQEYYRWDDVADAARRALGLRYALLPSLYTWMRASALKGCPLLRPAWMAFPRDNATHEIDRCAGGVCARWRVNVCKG